MKDKLDLRQTFLIGLGFFAVSLSWGVYNVYTPILLSQYLTTTLLIGVVMTIDNIFGVIFQPLFGRLSDKTNTRWGKRMPYIIIGAPIAALLFVTIPFTRSLFSLMAVVILFNFVMSAWRSPVVSLMPDLTPQKLQSQGNGIINLWGGIGSIFAFLFGGILFNAGGMPLPFVSAAVVMFIAVVVLFFTVKENKAIAARREATKDTTKEAPSKPLNAKEKRSLIFILLAIFFWFCGYNAIETYFSLFVVNTYPDMTAGNAGMLLAYYSLAFLVMAIPSGYIAARIGRKRCIIIGIIVMATIFGMMYFVRSISISTVFLIISGLAWAFININSLPMVTKMAGPGRIGSFIGYYYAFSQSASIVSPILFGFIRDLTGNYSMVFVYAAVAYSLALICMLNVRHGEINDNNSDDASGIELLADLD